MSLDRIGFLMVLSGGSFARYGVEKAWVSCPHWNGSGKGSRSGVAICMHDLRDTASQVSLRDQRTLSFTRRDAGLIVAGQADDCSIDFGRAGILALSSMARDDGLGIGGPFLRLDFWGDLCEGSGCPLSRSTPKLPTIEVSFVIELPHSSAVEQLTVNQRVVGSNPTAAATRFGVMFRKRIAWWQLQFQSLDPAARTRGAPSNLLGMIMIRSTCTRVPSWD